MRVSMNVKSSSTLPKRWRTSRASERLTPTMIRAIPKTAKISDRDTTGSDNTVRYGSKPGNASDDLAARASLARDRIIRRAPGKSVEMKHDLPRSLRLDNPSGDRLVLQRPGKFDSGTAWFAGCLIREVRS